MGLIYLLKMIQILRDRVLKNVKKQQRKKCKYERTIDAIP